ncbi:hypothetical protein BGW36DRAFT_360881 [Talaromyces proteolyticus]|uniref:DUF3533 domain-containing protein n=1 Tax=Talaromyces proteolyticus TaxID=1131652 RepID=A0AAD4PZ06_9EURO|nr:uncharacterized protein BGW36DRAFT_360881 [Talaromyces proteolyticus]KAH8695174.1 hypothetical protein BGW36DRAFT_360881 [Talaromyces proteolyticus]
MNRGGVTEQQAVAPRTGPPLEATKFTVATVILAFSVLLLFLLNQIYMFGSTFQQASRSHDLQILLVNYDSNDGPIWNSLVNASRALQAATYPTIVIGNPTQYPDPASLVHSVQEDHYWGALYVHPGASDRFSAVVTGRISSYNASNSISYVWNELRYAAISLSVIQAALVELHTAAQGILQASTARTLIEQPNITQTALSAYLTPLQAVEINLSPSPQASKAFYNTVIMAMAIVQQNVFLIAFSGMSTKFGLFSQPFKFSAGLYIIVGLAYTFVGALVPTVCMWTFREGWAISGSQFVETWLVIWFAMHIYYQLIDGTLALFPLQVYSHLLVTFVFLNVTSTIFPVELSAGFYRWGQSLPAFEVLQLLFNIWSQSSVRLYQSLPILFSWWVISASWSIAGLIKRRKDAAQLL